MLKDFRRIGLIFSLNANMPQLRSLIEDVKFLLLSMWGIFPKTRSMAINEGDMTFAPSYFRGKRGITSASWKNINIL